MLSLDEIFLSQWNFQRNKLCPFDLGTDFGVVEPSVWVFACHVAESGGRNTRNKITSIIPVFN